MKSLYTNVPLKEAIDIALRKLYVQDEPPSIARKTMKRLLNMAVSQVHFKCNETWYGQKDGLAMGASLAVILANFWLKQYKTALSRDIPEMFWPEKDLNGICPECNKKVTYRSKGVECECCVKWKIINNASSSIKLLTLEALHIRKERPAINTRDGLKVGS